MPSNADAGTPRCQLCGEPMPKGEEMFNYHGYSGPCPKPPIPATPGPNWKQLYESEQAAHANTMAIAARFANAIGLACDIIELGDQRLLADEGPIGNQPPDLTLDEWRRLYVTLDKARKAK